MRRLNFKILLERKKEELELALSKAEPHNALHNQFLIRLNRINIKKTHDQLELVSEALRRFENDTYGICQSCGKKINDRELLLNPEKRTCNLCSSDTHLSP